MNLHNILVAVIGITIAVVVFAALLPTIFSSILTVSGNTTYKTSFASSVDLVIIIPLVVVAVVLVMVLKEANIGGK